MPRLPLLLAFSVVALHTVPLHAAISFTNQAVSAGVADPGEANGAAFGDYDNDGWPDLLVTRLGDGERSRLYRNQGNGTFADRSALLPSGEQTMGGVFIDYDGDGDLDIFLVHFRRPNQLWRNDGDSFATVRWSETAGANLEGTSASFGDFDADGILDLFATHRRGWSNQYYTRFHRDGFANQSLVASLLRSGQDSFAAVPFDYDNDGDLDLYVSNLNRPNLLHRNDNRGLFTAAAEILQVQWNGASIGAFPADYDNDGDLDLYVINVSNQANVLYRNDSPEPFADATESAGVGQGKNTTGAAWADFDSDGDLDLILSNTDGPTVYANRGNGTFANVTLSAIADGTLAPDLYTAGVAVADYDHDGDVDVFLARVHGADILLRNDSPAAGHYLRVELRGRDGQQSALGARVTVRTPAGTQTREYVVTSVLGSLHGDLLHFGLGMAEEVEELTVEWPSGQRQRLRDVSTDQVLRVEQPLLTHDLRLRVLTPDLAPGWGALTPEIEVENVGSQRVASATLEARISRQDETVYSRSVAVPAGPPAGRRTPGRGHTSNTVERPRRPGPGRRQRRVLLPAAGRRPGAGALHAAAALNRTQ